MTQYKDGDRRFELLPPEDRARPPAETRRGVPAQYDFSDIPTGWFARQRSRAMSRALKEHTGDLQIIKGWAEAKTDAHLALHELEYAVARRALLPMRLEVEKNRLETEIAQGRGEFEAAVDFYADRRARRAEQRQLEAETHVLDMTRRKRLILEERLVIGDLEQRLKSGGSRTNTAASDPPDAFAEFMHTENEVHRSRSKAEAEIQAIYRGAAAQRRGLTDEERDRVAALDGASDAMEAHIRRGDAADF